MITAKRSIPWLLSKVRKRLSGRSCGMIISTTASRALFNCLLQCFRLFPKHVVKVPTFSFVLPLKVLGLLPGWEVGEPYLVPFLCHSTHDSMKRKSSQMNKISACLELNGLPRAPMESWRLIFHRLSMLHGSLQQGKEAREPQSWSNNLKPVSH